MYPTDRVYSKDHEWLRVEDDACVMGITDFAQHELGEIVFVELPEKGDSFDAHDEIGTVESVKAVAEVYTPVGGTVTAVNETLLDEPERVNEAPHESGWLLKLKLANASELDELMDAAAYEAFIGTGD
jgi:glycine cleavage system H protein